MSKSGFFYIMASRKNGTLYAGVTNNIIRRTMEHKEGKGSAFTAEHKVHKLVYYETYDCVIDAIVREKRVKEWKRDWKIELIQSMNPDWRDLYEDVVKG